MSKTPSLTALRAFQTVGHYRSFSQAAKFLKITTGALSQHVIRLENMLGITLIDRSIKKVTLTKQGWLLYNELATAFDIIGHAIEKLQTLDQGNTTLIKCPPVFASNWLVQRIDRLETVFGAGNVILRTGQKDKEHEETVAADLEICYGTARSVDTLRWQPLGPLRVFGYCTPGYLQQAGTIGHNERQRLLDYRLSGESLFEQEWDEWLARVGIDRTRVSWVHCDSDTACLNLARCGHGVVLTDPRFVADDERSGRLVRYHPHPIVPLARYWIRSTGGASEAHRRAIELLRREFSAPSASADPAGGDHKEGF